MQLYQILAYTMHGNMKKSYKITAKKISATNWNGEKGDER